MTATASSTTRRLMSWVGGLALLLASAVVHASPITYTLDRTVGAGTVRGTITTDGTLGVLQDANILSWSLDLQHPLMNSGATASISSSSGIGTWSGIVGDQLSATATDLSYDFGSSSLGSFILTDGPTYYWCVAVMPGTACGGGTVGVGESMGWMTTAGSAPFDVARSGQVVIASVVSDVPEPASMALVGIALVAAASVGRRRQAA